MLAEERFSLILDLLARQRTATVQELCEALNASESTIRRDLNELDKQGKLNKVHGGATLPDSPFRTDEPTMAAKEELAVSQKQSIAQAAAELILPEDFIYLDAGSSTLALHGAERPGPERQLCDQRRGPRPPAGPERLPGVPARRAAAAPDRGHHRGGCTDCHPAVQFHQSLHGSQRRGAGFRLYHPQTQRRPPSRLRLSTGHGRRGSWWTTPNSRRSTPPSSVICTAVPS